MKTALAVVCSLLLLWTQFVPVGAAGASEVSSARTACDCGAVRCCSADIPQPESQPVSAAPASLSQLQFLPAVGTPLWSLPGPETPTTTSPAPQIHGEATRLYALTCTLLI